MENLCRSITKRYSGILQRQYAKVVREAKAHTFCDVVNLPKGEIHYESSLNPVCDEEGICQFVICITRDITAQIEEKTEIEENKCYLSRYWNIIMTQLYL